MQLRDYLELRTSAGLMPLRLKFGKQHSQSLPLRLGQISKRLSPKSPNFLAAPTEKTDKETLANVETIIKEWVETAKELAPAHQSNMRPKSRCFRPISGGGKPVKPTASTGFMERAMGIEPTSEAREACCR